MNVLMVTPHLPPHQAANALLPHLLGRALEARGCGVRYLTFGDGPDTPEVAFVKRRGNRLRVTRLPQAVEAAETWWKGRALVRQADVIHIHSSTWVNQVAAQLALRASRPYLVTHYGTEIWHYDGRDRFFDALNRGARHVAFYSQALLQRARSLKVPLNAASVVYPPVADEFHPLPPERRQALRQELNPGGRGILLNVKRLHPLADHSTLLAAFALVHAEQPQTVLLIAGTGESEAELKAQAEGLGLKDSVQFLGLVPNARIAELQAVADLFLLSSLLEATPTVALEALACGTPVVSTDNPGGLELRELFGDDVSVVPKQDPHALAVATLDHLAANRRTGEATARRIAAMFRLEGVVERYLALYREVMAS